MSEESRFRRYPTWEERVHRRTAVRFVDALERARSVLRYIRGAGVDIRVFGSLVHGMDAEYRPFDEHSDVDFIVFSHVDEAERDALPRAVESLMGQLPVDLLFAEDIGDARLRQRLEESAVAELPALVSLPTRPAVAGDVIWIDILGAFEGMRWRWLRAHRALASLDEASGPSGGGRRRECVDAITFNLNTVCNRAERTLKDLVRHADGYRPTGPETFAALADRLGQDILGRRPAVLSAETVKRLDSLRRFRDRSRDAPIEVPEDRVRRAVRALTVTLDGFYRDVRTSAIGQGLVEADGLPASFADGGDGDTSTGDGS